MQKYLTPTLLTLSICAFAANSSDSQAKLGVLTDNTPSCSGSTCKKPTPVIIASSTNTNSAKISATATPNSNTDKQLSHRSSHRKHYRHYYRHHNETYPLNTMSFDFTYSGDSLNLPQALQQYDQSLNILSPVGKRKNINVNFALQNVKLQDVADSLNTQTNGQVTLQYDQSSNSIRLIFNTITDVGKSALSESLKWQDGSNPKPVLDPNGVVRFPYGLYQPVVTCQPLNLCDIELQAGEEVQGIVIGDSMRWNQGDKGIPIVYSGNNGNLTPHLVLKPAQAGLETSLLVTTSKHTYMFKLKSSNSNYVAQVGFYYPEQMMQQLESQKNNYIARVSASGVTKTNNPGTLLPLLDMDKLNYNYSVKGNDYPWKPVRVFDDGISVYIQMPPEVNARDLPGICVLVEGDINQNKCELVNYRYNNNFYIVDKLFTKARLINGFGDYVQTITITRNSDKPGFWQRLFGN